MPDAFLTDVYPNEIIMDDKKIPPPIPKNPESSPITPPIAKARGILTLLVLTVGFKYPRISKIAVEKIRKMPARILNQCGSAFIYPPKKAKGIDVTENAINTLLSKQPSLPRDA